MMKVEEVLLAHQRMDNGGGCGCGWNELGASFVKHQVQMLQNAEPIARCRALQMTTTKRCMSEVHNGNEHWCWSGDRYMKWTNW
jgi:hypothetical protein